jgi:hypothetical protein
LVEGEAGALEVGKFHPRIFAGEDDAVGIALEGGEDGIAKVKTNPMSQERDMGHPGDGSA